MCTMNSERGLDCGGMGGGDIEMGKVYVGMGIRVCFDVERMC